MKLEERVASALRTHADLLAPNTHDLAVIRASAKAQSRRRAAHRRWTLRDGRGRRGSPRELPTSAQDRSDDVAPVARPPPARRRPRRSRRSDDRHDVVDDLQVPTPIRPPWSAIPRTGPWFLHPEVEVRHRLRRSAEPRARGLRDPGRRRARERVVDAPRSRPQRRVDRVPRGLGRGLLRGVGQRAVHRDRRPCRRAVPRGARLPSRPARAVRDRRAGLLQRWHLRLRGDDRRRGVATRVGPVRGGRTAVLSGCSRVSCRPWRSGRPRRRPSNVVDRPPTFRPGASWLVSEPRHQPSPRSDDRRSP